MQAVRRRGRPGRFSAYEDFEASLPSVMRKRPAYLHGIGLFRGERGVTAWVKVTVRKGTTYKDRSYPPGSAIEIKLGARPSFTWEQLEAERDRLQGRADRGEPLDDKPNLLFADHSKAWLAQKRKTVRGYDTLKSIVTKHLDPAFGSKALADITVADVDRWQAWKLATHNPATVQRMTGTLKTILNNAVKLGLIGASPAAQAETVRGIEPRQRWLSADELEAVLKAADALEGEAEARKEWCPQEIRGWLRNFVLWALHSGMRRSEILNLRWKHVIPAKEGATVVVVEKTKSDRTRLIACNEAMLAVIQRLGELPRAEGDDRLFPISPTRAKRKLTKLWRRCGLDDVRLHDLRRTHASQLVRAGVDLRTVSGRIGHSDLAMLERVYAVFLGDQEAAQKAQEAFGALG